MIDNESRRIWEGHTDHNWSKTPSRRSYKNQRIHIQLFERSTWEVSYINWKSIKRNCQAQKTARREGKRIDLQITRQRQWDKYLQN